MTTNTKDPYVVKFGNFEKVRARYCTCTYYDIIKKKIEYAQRVML